MSSASITVVTAQASFTIIPAATRINVGDSRLFASIITESGSKAVTWSATAGSIVGSGDTIVFHAPAFATTVTITATRVANPTQVATAQVTVDDPSAGGTTEGQELLSAAYASGAHDASTYTRYLAYWAFGDPRFPPQYKGTGAGPEDMPQELIFRPDGISAAANAELDGFMLPPNARDSWYMQRHGLEQAAQNPRPRLAASKSEAGAANVGTIPALIEWRSMVAPGGKVRVWWDKAYPGHEPKAQTIATAVDVMWRQFATLLGREPISDASYPNDKNGGDGLVDVYLTGAVFGNSVYGMAVPYIQRLGSARPCVGSAAFLLLNARHPVNTILGTLAHELFHVFQYPFTSVDKCIDYLFLMESRPRGPKISRCRLSTPNGSLPAFLAGTIFA